jgi:signal transduction histidine kinase
MSPIYRFPWLLDVAMRLKYGAEYRVRLDRVGSLVPDGSRVVDLCAGSCSVYRHGLQGRVQWYRGFEISEPLVRRAQARGMPVEHADARRIDVPECDVVLCLDSLYQFDQQAESILRRAAERCSRIVILEPVENMVSSDFPPVAALAAWITDYGEGPATFRHTEATLNEVLGRVGTWTTDYGVQLTVSPVAYGAMIDADTPILAAALVNLLQNAFKFTRPDSHVLLHTHIGANRVQIEVSDECGGLPAGKIDELFSAFAQRGSDRTGLGLGLAISRRCIEENGGELHVRDEPGTGCVFTVDLPRHLESA